MKGVIDDCLAARTAMVVFHGGEHALTFRLYRKRYDRRGTATSGSNGAGSEVVRTYGTVSGRLIDVAMGIYPAGQHPLAARVDFLTTAWQVNTDGSDPPLPDAEIGDDGFCGGGDSTSADNQLELGDGAPRILSDNFPKQPAPPFHALPVHPGNP